MKELVVEFKVSREDSGGGRHQTPEPQSRTWRIPITADMPAVNNALASVIDEFADALVDVRGKAKGNKGYA